MLACLWALTDDCQLRANEGVLVPVSGEMRTDVQKHGLCRLISDCTVDPVSAILAFARAEEFDWAAPECVE